MRGLRLFDQPVLGETGYSPSELADIYYGLISDADAGLLFESESLEVMDAAYNPGEPVTESMVLDAVTAKYNRFPKTMAALQRVFNRQLSEEMKAEEPVIGTPKVSAGFATVTVQFPFADGQTVSIIFHAPDNDPKKINGADEVIAFRWLLNKRDITHIVAPEMTRGIMRDIPLQTVGKRITQLVEKNSARFTKKQGEVTQQREDLARNDELVKALSEQTVILADETGRVESSTVSNESTIEKLQATLDELRAENERLQSLIDELKAKKNDVDPMTLLDAGGLSVLKQLRAIGGNAVAERFNDRWLINYEAPGMFAEVNDGEPASSEELARLFVEEVSELLETQGERLKKLAEHNALIEFMKGGRLPKGWEKHFDTEDAARTYVSITTNLIPAEPDLAGEGGEFYEYAIFAHLDNGKADFVVTHDEGSELNGTSNSHVASWKEAIDLMKADATQRGIGQPPEPAADDLHWYGLQARPGGFGATPKDYAKIITKDEFAHNLTAQKIIEGFPDHAYRHGIIGYARPLTAEDISSFELYDFSKGNGAGLWSENDLAEKLYELGQLAEKFDGEFTQFFADIVKTDQSPFWDQQNNKFAAKQLQTALENLYGEKKGGQELLRRFWQEQTGKDPAAGKVDTAKIAETLVSLLRESGFDADSSDIAFKTFAVGFERDAADGTVYVYKNGLLKVAEFNNGEQDLDDQTFDTAEEAANFIISNIPANTETGGNTPEVELTMGTPLVINGKTFKIAEVSHDEGKLTFSADEPSDPFMGMGQIMRFDDFEKKYAVKVKRRPTLVDDGTSEYYESRIKQLYWDTENTSNGIARNNMRTEIRSLEASLAKVQGVDNIAITDEMVEHYRTSGAVSDTLQWLREKFGYSAAIARALLDRIEIEAGERATREYMTRPHVRLAQRIFNYIEKDYPSSKRGEGVQQSLTIAVGAGRVGMDEPEIDGEMFTLKATYWPKDINDYTYSGGKQWFEKKYPLVDGLILDDANKADAVLEEIRGDIAVFVKTFETRVDNSNLPAYGSKVEETSDLSTKELAALIRNEIKDKMKSGVLPKGKYSVRKEHSSSLSISVQDLPEDFPLFNPAYLKDKDDADSRGNRTPRYHNETRALLEHLEAIAKQYHYNNSDSMTDYFDTAFYLSVGVDYQFEASRKESEKPQNAEIPEDVWTLIERNYRSMVSHGEEMDRLRKVDKDQGGEGRYEYDGWTNTIKSAVESVEAQYQKLKNKAREKGIDLDKAVEDRLGAPMPVVALSYEGQEWEKAAQSRKDKYMEEFSRKLETLRGQDLPAWKMPRDDWALMQVVNGEYADEYLNPKNERLLNSQLRGYHDEWVSELEDRARVGRISTAAIDDYVARHGIEALRAKFRGSLEPGIEGYESKGTRLWDKTYKQVQAMKKEGDLGVMGEGSLSMKELHRMDIKKAMEAGETIPENVLKEYPELTKQAESEELSPEITEAVETLKKAAAGDYQTFAATMDAAEKAINTLDAAGVADEYDDLIGQATDKAFEMDTAENGA